MNVEHISDGKKEREIGALAAGFRTILEVWDDPSEPNGIPSKRYYETGLSAAEALRRELVAILEARRNCRGSSAPGPLKWPAAKATDPDVRNIVEGYLACFCDPEFVPPEYQMQPTADNFDLVLRAIDILCAELIEEFVGGEYDDFTPAMLPTPWKPTL
jgi:hypothetical protein